jgi:RNA polymerase primary sigma factor
MAERLTAEDEKELALRIQAGDEASFHHLVRSNLAFVAAVARPYRSCGIPFEDLVSEGNLGLLEAARRFDAARGTRFTTFAVWWIRKAVLRALTRQAVMVRVPDKRRREARAAGERRIEVVSIDQPAGRTDVLLGDLLPDRRTADPETHLARREARRLVVAAIRALDPRERAIVQARFGMDGRAILPLRETGGMFGLSREAVRLIEKRALRKMRRMLVRRELRLGNRRQPSSGVKARWKPDPTAMPITAPARTSLG